MPRKIKETIKLDDLHRSNGVPNRTPVLCRRFDPCQTGPIQFLKRTEYRSMQSKLCAAVGFTSLLLQASASFGQVVFRYDTVTTYDTVCHDEPKTTSYDTGNVSCKVANEHTGKSVDFSSTGSCDPVMEAITKMIPVCEQVPKTVQVPVFLPETCTGLLTGAGPSCGGSGD